MSRLENGGLDSALGVHTPEGIEFTLYPAGIPVRACAWAIDVIFQGILFIIIIIFAGILSWVLGGWIIYIIFFALNWFYHTAFEIFCRGQSPGKKIMGIRVVRGDGSPVNPGASLLRNLLRFADTFMFLYLIAYFCMLYSRAFKRIGDWTADTLVVYTARNSGRFTSPYLKQVTMPWLASFPAITPAFKLNYEEKQTILSFARRYPLLGVSRADELARIWVDKLRSTETESSGSEAEPSGSAYLLGIARSISGTQPGLKT